MELLLVRHAESEKNERAAFSEPGRGAGVTERGAIEAQRTANAVSEFIEVLSLEAKYVHCSDSERSCATAEIIADRLGIGIKIHEQLSSIKLVGVVGMTEKSAAAVIPEFMYELALFRAGVLDAYQMSPPVGSENHAEFERRICNRLNEILCEPSETMKIVVLHRSPLTAALIHFARIGHGYPSNFFGHIPLSLAHVSWIDCPRTGRCRIRGVNIAARDLIAAARYSMR
jgi:broad specificity phosphatase PhoE